MPTPEQKDPLSPSGSAGGSTPSGGSGLSRNEKIALAILGVIGILALIYH